MRWEYKILVLVDSDLTNFELQLNVLGDEGWEVIQINEANIKFRVVYLKREVIGGGGGPGGGP